KHNGVTHRGVQNWIGEKRNRLHRRMVTVSLWFIKFPDGGFFPTCIPLMLAFLLPAKQHRFVLPLIRRTPQYKGVLFPYTTAGQVKTGIRKGFSKIKPFGVGMEYIDRSSVCQCFFDIDKGI